MATLTLLTTGTQDTHAQVESVTWTAPGRTGGTIQVSSAIIPLAPVAEIDLALTDHEQDLSWRGWGGNWETSYPSVGECIAIVTNGIETTLTFELVNESFDAN